MKFILISAGGILLAPLGPDSTRSEREPCARALTTVTIDIRPDCPSNWVVLGSPAEIPVAVFGSAAFSVAFVDSASLLFAGAPATSAFIDDLDGDGFLDLVSTYAVSALDLDSSSTSAELSGLDIFAGAFSGTDYVVIFSSAEPSVSVVDDGSGYSATLTGGGGHPLVTYSLSDLASAVDACGNSIPVDSSAGIVRITADEVSRGKKTAARDPSMVILTGSSFSVRDQRNGGADGRVYTVYFTVSDGSGNSTASSFQIQVRPANGPNAIDSGVADCVGSCP